MRIAAPGYIVPFMFVYSPSLLMIGEWSTIATSSVTGLIGVVSLSAGLQGYLTRDCRPWERVVLVAAALALIKPGYVTDAVGLGLLALVWAAQRLQARSRAAVPGAASK
jgi:TRAP-type uncharacterized transport system fused permease subunit